MWRNLTNLSCHVVSSMSSLVLPANHCFGWMHISLHTSGKLTTLGSSSECQRNQLHKTKAQEYKEPHTNTCVNNVKIVAVTKVGHSPEYSQRFNLRLASFILKVKFCGTAEAIAKTLLSILVWMSFGIQIVILAKQKISFDSPSLQQPQFSLNKWKWSTGVAAGARDVIAQNACRSGLRVSFPFDRHFCLLFFISCVHNIVKKIVCIL